MALPLVQLGPGGDFTTRIGVKGRRLTRSRGVGDASQANADHESAASLATWVLPAEDEADAGDMGGPSARMQDSFEHQPAAGAPIAGAYDRTGRVVDHDGRLAALQAAVAWLTTQRRDLLGLAAAVDALRANLQSDRLAAVPSLTPGTTSDEPHPQAAPNPHPHPRRPSGTGLLPDHAGTRRRTGRLQGHRLRARRSAHQKGSVAARSQQSPLFAGVA